MRRNYYSPSAVGLIERCQRAAAYQYIAGLRDPNVAWADIESGRIKVLKRGDRARPGYCLPRQRSTALGSAVHKVFEDRYSGRDPNWFNLPGRIAASGAHLIPEPSECDVIEVERAVGKIPSGEKDPKKPQFIRELDGIRWAGNRDLLVHSPAGCERLGIFGAEGWLLVDYKSTSSIRNYAKTCAELERDIQRALYGLDSCIRSGLDYSLGRWLYLETGATRRAAPVDTVLTRDQSIEVLRSHHDAILAFDRIERVEDSECNASACNDYGGCPYHVSAGGPCNARRSLGSLMKRATINKEVNIMALSPEAQARFEAAKKARADAAAGFARTGAGFAAGAVGGAVGATPAAASAPPVETEVVELDQEEPADEGEALTVEAITPAAGSRAEKIRILSDLLAVKEAQAALVQQSITEIVAQIAEACK